MLRTVLSTFLCLGVSLSFANELSVSEVKLEPSGRTITFDISWKNSWKNAKNHDAAWIFVKMRNRNGAVEHARLNKSGHAITGGNVTGSLVLPDDRVGIFIQSATDYRGDVKWSVELQLSERYSANATAEVYAIEMVFIPESPFHLGSTDRKALDYASFYKSDADGEPLSLFSIESEDQEIVVAPSSGNLYYKVGRSPYRGDMKGTVPPAFPKGYRAFYMMKYETTQGLYSDFLNTLTPELAAKLTPMHVEDYYEKKGSIRMVGEKYVASSPARPANYITWDDGAAMADWAGLRPMTEFEFTKAARGPEKPIVHDFPWGTDNTNQLKRKVALTDELILEGVNEKELNDSNRAVYGASYYWVMDLAGSLWEKCVTIGHPIGRAYTGTHGDGTISSDGNATNEDWPKGIKEEGGYGYRGGGYYHHGMKVSDFNPHSPVAYRPYGSWAGGDRSIAYSQRYVRSAK